MVVRIFFSLSERKRALLSRDIFFLFFFSPPEKRVSREEEERKEEEREDEEEEVKEVFCVPLIFAEDDFELVDEAFIPSRPLLFLNEEEKEE